MNREHIKYAIIGIAIILSAYLLGRAYTYKYRSQDTVVVTGLGETEFYAFTEKVFALPEVRALLMEAVNAHNQASQKGKG